MSLARFVTPSDVNPAQEVAARQKVVLWIAVAASSSAIMLGLVVAWMITRHLTHPIRSC
ncbi:MAG: hypothetical protein IPK95_00035 [Cellvibrionales bacterium]|nr:hypothetical protein [Cellvibrionales bacterium]